MAERDGAKVAQILRDAILRLDLRPGVLLDEADLGTRLNVSRTPIREAIIQLIAEGLIVREGRKAKVAPLDFDDVPKLYDALLISSRLVHRQAALHRSGADLDAIAKEMRAFEEASETGDGVRRSQANLEYHKAISAAADNRYISAFYEEALIGTIRLSRACFTKIESDAADTGVLSAHLAETMRQHRDIYDAIARSDAEAADAMAVTHYELTKRRVLEVLFSQSQAFAEMENLTLDSWEMA